MISKREDNYTKDYAERIFCEFNLKPGDQISYKTDSSLRVGIVIEQYRNYILIKTENYTTTLHKASLLCGHITNVHINGNRFYKPSRAKE